MKVAIIGIESSHAWSFASKFAGRENNTSIFDDVELVGVYGDASIEGTEAGVEEIKRCSECECFATTYDAFVDKVDAVMITARHGKLHLPYSKPYLEKGLPVWLDKPICTDTQEVMELVSLAKKYHAPICGGSCLVFSVEIRKLRDTVKENREKIRGGHITAPIDMANSYGNFWFYASHLVQMMIEIFGFEVRSVTAVRMKDSVQAVYKYDDFYVSAFFGTGYTATVYIGENRAKCADVTLSGCLEAELKEFYHMVKSGQGIEDYKAFVAPVFIIDATIEAYEKGIEAEISIPEMKDDTF